MVGKSKYLIVGPAGSGKDWLQQRFIEKGYTPLVQYTTRPMRPTENGTEYHFISQKLMGKMIREMKFLSVKNFKTWWYGFVKEDFEKSKLVSLNAGQLAGQNEAWELAKKITCQPINGGFTKSEFEEIFGYDYVSDIFKKYTYSEASKKVAEWEKAKKEIKVGDVLESINDSKVKCVATNLYPNNRAYLVFDDGTT